MAGTEATDALTWMFGILNGDTTLQAFGLHGWFKDRAQPKTDGTLAWPFGIGQFQGGADVTFMSSVRIAVNGLMVLKVVGFDSDFDSILRPAYKRVDALIHGTQGSTSDVVIVGKVIREQPLDYPDPVPVNGQTIRHLGGVYRFLAQ